ncbi:F0F1 ATP synthase subunit delta [Amnibacterium sp.]|uniref:F0F1 ATP synthase subunit delta n=1 Tax=Amnibacterium sp. TaxID=1872496 RepID=UPI003F7BD945
MGAATRASTKAGLDALAAVQRPQADLGAQLLSAARALGSSHQLVGVLADPGIPAAQRAGVADKAFASLGAQARSILGVLAGGRWSRQQDLVGAVEEVGLRAIAAPASADGLESELFSVVRTIQSDGRLELALGASSAPLAARIALVDTLLVDAKPATREVVRHVVQLPRGRKPVEALQHAQSVVAAARDSLVAVVQVASPLSAAQAAALAARLESGYGRKISVNQVIDPGLLGGVRITIGDDVIDGTVRARLDDLRLRLAG